MLRTEAGHHPLNSHASTLSPTECEMATADLTGGKYGFVGGRTSTDGFGRGVPQADGRVKSVTHSSGGVGNLFVSFDLPNLIRNLRYPSKALAVAMAKILPTLHGPKLESL